MSANQNEYQAKSPYCDHVLDPASAVDGWITCECGRKSDVRWVRELGWLQSRSAWVSERVANSEAWFDSRQQKYASSKESHNKATGQQLLYILGGISLFVATTVFTAVAWERIGAIGQLTALIAVVATASLVAIKSRENLISLSNTSAILATIVAGTGLVSAPYFGLVDKEFSKPNSIFTTMVFVFLVVASFAAGRITKIPGWTVIAIIGLVPTGLIFSESYLHSSQSNTIYLVGSMASFTLGAITAAYLLKLAMRNQEISKTFKVAVTSIEILFVFMMFTKLMDSMQANELPLVVGGSYLAIAALWVLVAYKIPRVATGFTSNAISTMSGYIASVLIGFALPITLISAVDLPATPSDWMPIPGSPDIPVSLGLIIGTAIMMLPLFAAVNNLGINKYFTITAAVTWYATSEISNRLTFEDSVSKPIVFFAFAMMSVSLTARWWKSVNGWFFGTAALAGSIAVGYGVANFTTINFDGPELATFPISSYLILMGQLLIYRTRNPQNSLIIWGIPLTVVLIPSAIWANQLLFTEFPGTAEWVRFWAVLFTSVAAVVLGMRSNLSGLLIPGTVGFAIVSLPQVFLQLSLFVPRWVIFGVIGVLLITIAARFEHLRKLGSDTSTWFKKLN